MFDTFVEMMSFPFIVRAFIIGILVSLCSALLGVSLVLKRYSMIGDGLSHVGFGAVAVATAFHLAPMWVSIPVVVFSAFLLLRVSENSKIKGDAQIALISTSALAIGVITMALSTGIKTDVCNFMFGSILAINSSEMPIGIGLSVVVLILFVLLYDRIFAVTFDENFAKSSGINVELYNMLIAILTAITIVLGMRMMGTLLISSLIIFPALTAMRVSKTFKNVIIISAILSVFCFVVGLYISYLKPIPTGASVVIVNLTMFIIFWIIGMFKNGKVLYK